MISRNLLLVYGFVYIHMNRLSTQLFHCVGGDRAPAPSAPTADRSVGLHCTSKECARLKHALTRPLESAHIALHTWAKCQKLAKNLIQKFCKMEWFYSCLQSLIQCRPNCSELRSMDSYTQILCRFQKKSKLFLHRH